MTLEHDHAAHHDAAHDDAAHDDADHRHGDDHGHAAGEHDHGGHEHVDYPTAVELFRADKDDYFRQAHDSPVPHGQRKDFTGLPYFPVDENLRFEGLELQPYDGDEPTTFQIPTSDGQLRDEQRAGIFRFELGGEERRLTGYRFASGGSESVFVPFLDQTSGRETYGAGRYLDLDPDPEDGTFVLDFNLAYHPSCVYDPRFSCPLTPAENRLPVHI